MARQIAVRLPDELVTFVDELVASGQAKSRATVVAEALEREERRQLAERDAVILAASHDDPEGFDDLATFSAGLAIDLD